MTPRVLSMLMLVLSAAPGSAAERTGVLFPAPFVVEHSLVQVEPDGSRFETEPVVDHYGGGWIVSLRPDGSRLMLDLARREMTELWPDHGSYAALSFDRFAALTRRLSIAEGEIFQDADGSSRDSWRLVPQEREPALEARDTKSGVDGTKPFQRPGTRHLVVRASHPDADFVRTAPLPVEVWVSPEVRLGAGALAGLEDLDRAFAGGRGDVPTAAEMVAEARRAADGAFVVRTVRRFRVGERPDDVATIEDVAHRVEPLDALPADLLEIPDTYRRVAHPLEVMVENAEAEAELRRRDGLR